MGNDSREVLGIAAAKEEEMEKVFHCSCICLTLSSEWSNISVCPWVCLVWLYKLVQVRKWREKGGEFLQHVVDWTLQ